MPLNNMQQRFRDTMLDHPDVLESPPEDFAVLFETGTIPLPERLKVYRNNIVGGITDVLVATFPMTEKLVGREFLEGMARSFLLQNPPQTGCLSLYGEGFDDFVAAFEPAKQLPYLPDVIRLELALNKAYYAADDTALTAEELAAIPEEHIGEAILTLRSSAQFVVSQYPLTDIRDLCLGVTDERLDLDKGSVSLMVYRPSLQTSLVSLLPAEHEMLGHIAASETLSGALEQTLKNHPDFDIQQFLARHIELETFSSL